MKVSSCCNRKVVMMEGSESVKSAAELMRQHHVGDIVLVDKYDGKRIPIGIITDRDLVLEVMALGVNASDLAAEDLIARSVLSVHEDDYLFDALELMRNSGVRRLPVINSDDELIGIITFDDITELLAETLYNVVGVIKQQRANEIKQRT